MSKEEQVPQEGEFKMKKKPGRPRKLNKTDEPVKLDLTKKEENAIQTPEANDSNAVVEESKNETNSEKVVEEVRSTEKEEVEEKPKEVIEKTKEDKPAIEEIKIGEEQKEIEPAVAEQIKEEIKQNPEIELPENVEKLVDFMKETGGTLVDYVRLNADYSNVNEEA